MRCDQRSRGGRRSSARESDTSIRARPSRVLMDSPIGGAPCFNARVTSSEITLWASFRTVRRQSRSHLDTAWRGMPGAVACGWQLQLPRRHDTPFHMSRCRWPTQRPPRPVVLRAARSATRRGQMAVPVALLLIRRREVLQRQRRREQRARHPGGGATRAVLRGLGGDPREPHRKTASRAIQVSEARPFHVS